MLLPEACLAGLSEKTLRTVTDSKGRQVIGIENLDGLLSLVQAGVLEIDVRGARLDSLEVCDRIVFDLDPGEGADWSAMVTAARDVAGAWVRSGSRAS